MKDFTFQAQLTKLSTGKPLGKESASEVTLGITFEGNALDISLDKLKKFTKAGVLDITIRPTQLDLDKPIGEGNGSEEPESDEAGAD